MMRYLILILVVSFLGAEDKAAMVAERIEKAEATISHLKQEHTDLILDGYTPSPELYDDEILRLQRQVKSDKILLEVLREKSSAASEASEAESRWDFNMLLRFVGSRMQHHQNNEDYVMRTVWKRAYEAMGGDIIALYTETNPSVKRGSWEEWDFDHIGEFIGAMVKHHGTDLHYEGVDRSWSEIYEMIHSDMRTMIVARNKRLREDGRK